VKGDERVEMDLLAQVFGKFGVKAASGTAVSRCFTDAMRHHLSASLCTIFLCVCWLYVQHPSEEAALRAQSASLARSIKKSFAFLLVLLRTHLMAAAWVLLSCQSQ
jgi:hypothetical protein